eukprot:818618_1
MLYLYALPKVENMCGLVREKRVFDSMSLPRMVDMLFFRLPATERFELVEEFEMSTFCISGKFEIEMHALLKLIIERYKSLKTNFQARSLRYFFKMGFARADRELRFEDFHPSLKMLLHGVPSDLAERALTTLREQPMMPGQPGFDRFASLTMSLFDIKKSFIMPQFGEFQRPGLANADHISESLCDMVGARLSWFDSHLYSTVKSFAEQFAQP